MIWALCIEEKRGFELIAKFDRDDLVEKQVVSGSDLAIGDSSDTNWRVLQIYPNGYFTRQLEMMVKLLRGVDSATSSTFEIYLANFMAYGCSKKVRTRVLETTQRQAARERERRGE